MVSPRKSHSALSLIPEEGSRMNPTPTKSCESLYSNTSSSKGSANMIYRRKAPTAPMQAGMRQPTLIPATNEVRQRVLSARRLRMKTFQNQLADAQQTIAELAHENRILRTLHKRQDSALARYESTNAELPQLLHSHAEELRVWQTKYRNLQVANKELEQKLKHKESIILSLSDQNKYYSQLNKDKNLEERQRLTEKLQSLESRLQEKDYEMKVMARKMQLEAKQFKQQLQSEQRKTKEALMKLEKARLELLGYRKLEELTLQEKFSNLTLRRNNKTTSDDQPKLEKDLDKLSSSEQDAEGSASHRSMRSSKLSTTTRTTRKMSANPSSPLTQTTRPHHKDYTPIAVLRRVDRGDGDAQVLDEVLPISSSKQHSPTSMQSKFSKKPTNEEHEDEYGAADVGHEEVEIENADELIDDMADKSTYDSNDADVQNEDMEDSFEDSNETEEITDSSRKSRMKEDISKIRRQITDDYKEREAFLDTFCRQATNGIVRKETPLKRNSIATEHNIPSSRKHKLLAALKAIDDNKSQD